MLSPFECLCGNFILPEPASYVFLSSFQFAQVIVPYRLTFIGNIKNLCTIIATSKLVVCTASRRGIYGLALEGGTESLTPHYHYRKPLQAAVLSKIAKGHFTSWEYKYNVVTDTLIYPHGKTLRHTVTGRDRERIYRSTRPNAAVIRVVKNAGRTKKGRRWCGAIYVVGVSGLCRATPKNRTWHGSIRKAQEAHRARI